MYISIDINCKQCLVREAGPGPTERPGECYLRDAARFQEFLEQNLAGVGWVLVLIQGFTAPERAHLVIIDNLRTRGEIIQCGDLAANGEQFLSSLRRFLGWLMYSAVKFTSIFRLDRGPA